MLSLIQFRSQAQVLKNFRSALREHEPWLQRTSSRQLLESWNMFGL
jgi:hypothetical protein